MKNFSLFNKNILRPDYIPTIRGQMTEKYITQPFFNTLGQREIKIIVAPTGFGKTWAIWNIISPSFLKDYGCLHIHVAPHIETIDEKEIESYISTSFRNQDYPLVIYNNSPIDFTHIRNSLLKGRSVILTLSDQSLMKLMNEKDSRLLQLVSDYGSETLLTRDEFSYGTTTSADNYKNDKGHSNSKYRATFINNLHALYQCGCEFYAFTATPSREHLGELPLAFETDMKIINEWPKKEEILLFQAWWEILQVTDYTEEQYNDDSILIQELKNLNEEVRQRERRLDMILDDTPYVDPSPKFTSMLSVQTDTGSETRFTTKSVLETIRNNPNIISPEYTFIITTADGWQEYDSHGQKTGNSGSGSEWLSLMNSNTSSARMLVVIFKGTYGINIPSLCAGVSLRCPKAMSSDTKETIRNGGLQFLGRFNRSNMDARSWKIFDDLTKNYGAERGLEYLQIKNTFTFRAPDGVNSYWNDTIKDFKERNGNSFGDMITHLYQK